MQSWLCWGTLGRLGFWPPEETSAVLGWPWSDTGPSRPCQTFPPDWANRTTGVDTPGLASSQWRRRWASGILPAGWWATGRWWCREAWWDPELLTAGRTGADGASQPPQGLSLSSDWGLWPLQCGWCGRSDEISAVWSDTQRGGAEGRRQESLSPNHQPACVGHQWMCQSCCCCCWLEPGRAPWLAEALKTARLRMMMMMKHQRYETLYMPCTVWTSDRSCPLFWAFAPPAH